MLNTKLDQTSFGMNQDIPIKSISNLLQVFPISALEYCSIASNSRYSVNIRFQHKI